MRKPMNNLLNLYEEIDFLQNQLDELVDEMEQRGCSALEIQSSKAYQKINSKIQRLEAYLMDEFSELRGY